MTLREAAEILGVSAEAIRKRIKRGTLPSDKGEDGRRYVYLDAAPDDAHPRSEDQGSSSPLVEELRDRVRSLEDSLQAERRANDENRRLLAAALERIPAIEAPPAASESPQERPEEGSPTSDTPDQGEGFREDPGRAPWWRRIFGG